MPDPIPTDPKPSSPNPGGPKPEDHPDHPDLVK